MSTTLEPEKVTILDLLDRLLDRGVVLSGNLTISVAGVDLLFLDLQLVLALCVRELGPPRLGSGISPSVRAPVESA